MTPHTALQTSDAPLLQQWGLLSDHVVPRLLQSSGPASPSVWADGEVSDAVAVSLAYRHGSSEPRRGLDLFATTRSGP